MPHSRPPRRAPFLGLLAAGATSLGLGLAPGFVAEGRAAPAWLNLPIGERSRPVAAVGRYGIDMGGGFVLDRGGPAALLRFDDSPEVWVLTTARGPRGDVIFSNDLGQPLVRTTILGGVTVFTRRHPEGAAAAFEGAASPIRLTRADPGQLYQRLVLASARASHAAQRLIAFQALEVDGDSSAVIADAALVATESVVQLSAGGGGRVILSRIGRIDFTRGRSAEAAFDGAVISITVAPRAGLGGRPSSARILRAVLLGARPAVSP